MTSPDRPKVFVSGALLVAALCQLAASFEVQTIPGDAANTQVFIAQTGADGSSGLFVLSGHTLTMVRHGAHESDLIFALEKGTTAIDIADLNRDGRPELYSVVGSEIRQRMLDSGAEGLTSRVLFSQETLLSESEAGPQPHVLAIDWEDRPALALPKKSGLSIYDLDGTLLEHFAQEQAPQGLLPLQHALVTPAQAGQPGAIELRVDLLFNPPVPTAFAANDEKVSPPYRRATYTQARQASKLPPADWPWFLLAPAKSPGQRVMYAIGDSNQGLTLVRIRSVDSGEGSDSSGAFRYSPRRRYPGTLVTPPGMAPDFNADGYSDLLLWTSPRPGTSIDSLMRAAQARTWPVRLTTHQFSKLKGIYSGRPSTRIELRLPIAWSLALDGGSPLRHLVLQDINGDGRTDIGLAIGPKRFALWICKASGAFSTSPDYTAELPEAIEGVPLVAKVGPGNTPVVALQASKALYLLRPQP